MPQFLLEEMCAAGRGGECRIVVTQPRRIAAIALAERVAAERGNGKAGGAVGYAVRLESRQTEATRLLFCTTGVLLQKLRSDPALRALSHVVVDEVLHSARSRAGPPLPAAPCARPRPVLPRPAPYTRAPCSPP